VGCLYCGKEIGAFRLIRDSEFCSAVHRTRYHDKLGKALDRISAPDPPPAGIAPFRIDYPCQTGVTLSRAAAHVPHPRDPYVGQTWSVSLARATGGSIYPAPNSAEPVVARAAVLACASWPSTAVPDRVQWPPFRIASSIAIPDGDVSMPAPEPSPAERWIFLSSSEAIPAAIAFRRPQIGDLPVVSTFIREISAPAPLPDPDPVERGVFAAIDSRPAPYNRPLALLRFSLHAVDEPEALSAPVLPVPDEAGARPGLPATPAESLPSTPATLPAARPFITEVLLPSVRALTAQVLPQARLLAGPAPQPVESMPASGLPAVSPVRPRPALRLPSLSRFQTAEDSSETLAAPVAAPGPLPVESLPAIAAFAALPAPVSAPILMRGFQADIRARFTLPAVAAPVPAIGGPPAARPRPAALDPLARIAAQPAGAQPERPVPAIPRPGPFLLEYHSQRIISAPVKRIQPLETPFVVRQQPFAVSAALESLDDLLRGIPARSVFPFEEIFGRRNRVALRARLRESLRLSIPGKIAAAFLVGIALWTAARMANLSSQTEALRAQVAASERAVAVAEAPGADPTLGNFGAGPLGRVRRAIAGRAATEITDTFRAGMTAWGAATQSWANGWKRHPQGYVSTGEMALFQPSLTYSDYRMEFYGQIEEKSLGWVVRAQDKKNYYAMKVMVIEPGLRPIIAMVHYGVVNGKPGHKVQTPLSVMVHNNRPIQVAVDVRGNHFTASVDGEQVESWTDDTLAQGGVGFFSEAGEKARLYWMKLSRNQDWLGRFCAYLSGDSRSRQQTAEVWGPGIPQEKPAPVLPRAPVVALAGAGPAGGLRIVRISKWK
jgi:hypothetical protein